MANPQENGIERGTEVERMVFFSDAVFAIAITLLALNISVPDIPENLVATELPMMLFELWPRFLSYALSFLIIGSYWKAHHRTFQYIVGYDRALLSMNNFLLMWVALIPFSSSLLGEYGNHQIAVVIYAAHMAVAGLSLSALWWYASRNARLLDPNINWREAAYTNLRAVVLPIVFLLSIAVSFINVTAAEVCWILLLVVRPILLRYIERYRSS